MKCPSPGTVGATGGAYLLGEFHFNRRTTFCCPLRRDVSGFSAALGREGNNTRVPALISSTPALSFLVD